MKDRTRQIVEMLLRAPELARALKQDPNAFAARFGVGERELELLQTGKHLVNDLVNRLCSQVSNPLDSSVANASPNLLSAGQIRACPSSRCGPSARNSSSVALVAVTSLAAITGMLAALGTVSVVGINSNGHSDDTA